MTPARCRHIRTLAGDSTQLANIIGELSGHRPQPSLVRAWCMDSRTHGPGLYNQIWLEKIEERLRKVAEDE